VTKDLFSGQKFYFKKGTLSPFFYFTPLFKIGGVAKISEVL